MKFQEKLKREIKNLIKHLDIYRKVYEVSSHFIQRLRMMLYDLSRCDQISIYLTIFSHSSPLQLCFVTEKFMRITPFLVPFILQTKC